MLPGRWNNSAESSSAAGQWLAFIVRDRADQSTDTGRVEPVLLLFPRGCPHFLGFRGTFWNAQVAPEEFEQSLASRSNARFWRDSLELFP